MDEKRILERDLDDFPLVRSKSSPEDVQRLLDICTGSHWNFRSLMDHVHGPDSPYDPSKADIGVFRSIKLVTSSDKELRLRGQSGGVSLTLLSHAFRTGLIDAALAVRRPNSEPFATESYIARSAEELADSAGSKYTICPTLDKLSQLTETSVAFALTTLPCQTAAFWRLVQERQGSWGDKCRLIIGPFCGLNMNKTMGPEFASAVGIAPDRVVRFGNRSGPFPGNTQLKTDDGTVREFDRTAHRLLYRMYSPPRCFTCTDYGNELADLVIADCWRQTRAGEYDFPEGSAYVIARTERGESFLKQILESGDLIDLDLNPAQAMAGWEQSFIYRKVRAHNRIRRFEKKGIPVPKLDYPVPAYFKPSRQADLFEFTIWRLFQRRSIRQWTLHKWLQISQAEAGSFRHMVFEDSKSFLFNHLYGQFTPAARRLLFRRYWDFGKRKVAKFLKWST